MDGLKDLRKAPNSSTLTLVDACDIHIKRCRLGIFKMTGLLLVYQTRRIYFGNLVWGGVKHQNACAEYIFGSRLFANGTLAAKSTAAANCGVIAGRERMKEDGIALALLAVRATHVSHGQSCLSCLN